MAMDDEMIVEIDFEKRILWQYLNMPTARKDDYRARDKSRVLLSRIYSRQAARSLFRTNLTSNLFSTDPNENVTVQQCSTNPILWWSVPCRKAFESENETETNWTPTITLAVATAEMLLFQQYAARV